jgi:hypothetical protein
LSEHLVGNLGAEAARDLVQILADEGGIAHVFMVTPPDEN